MSAAKPHTTTDLAELPFDQYGRQLMAARFLGSIREGRRLKILDIGGSGGKTRSFLPDDEVTVIDLEGEEGPGFVRGDALELPFADRSFDVCVSFDVYEHIPAAKRRQFIAEAARVCTDSLVIAMPLDSDALKSTERDLAEFYNQLSGRRHRWLEEHAAMGLPQRQELEDSLRAAKMQFTRSSTNYLPFWSLLQRLIFMADAVGAPEKIQAVQRFYNNNLEAVGDQKEPGYRSIYFARKAGEPLAPQRKTAGEIEPQILTQLFALVMAGVQDLAFSDKAAIDRSQTIGAKDREIERLKGELEGMLASASWRITKPLRSLKHWGARDV